jgi:hypothetical protein
MQTQKFDKNKLDALDRRYVHQSVQFYFNDKFFYFMNSYNTKSKSIIGALDRIHDAESKFDQLEEYARTAIQAGKDLGVKPSRRILELDMQNFLSTEKSHREADTGQNSNSSNSTQTQNMSIDDKYRVYTKGVMDKEDELRVFVTQKQEMKELSTKLADSIAGSLEFSDTINGVHETLKDIVMNHLYKQGYKDIYRVEEQHIWLLGWLLFSKQQFESWQVRPKDMISDPSYLSTLNHTDFMIINDYLDDLIREARLRGVGNDFDNSRFAFHIMRGMKFNITDIKNVTNCTNKLLSCPCPPDMDPKDPTYCDNKTNTAKPSSTNTTKRILQTASKGPATSPDPFAEKKSDSDPLTQANKKPELNFGTAVRVITPFTTIQSFEANYKQEKDIKGFVVAYKTIMAQYLKKELLGPLPSPDR